MRIHHLNCASLCPPGGLLVDGRSRGLRGRLTCHCLLVEGPDSLVLIDTGLGLRDVFSPHKRLSRLFQTLAHPEIRADLTAARQVESLGFDPQDVRHIVLSHLDCDHAGGLDDFPWATVHLLADEQAAAFSGERRYREEQFSTVRRWHPYPVGEGEPWQGFSAVRNLECVPPEILMVPLMGHSAGHAGVAIDRGEEGWLLYAADAYFYREEMSPSASCTLGLRAWQWLVEQNHQARRWNQQRLRQLRRTMGDELTLFCAHDPVEFETLAHRRIDRPADRVEHPIPVAQQPLYP
jgi:glyoxylase-like metal-dependent hydrolase (beta-lactamase superfamily II)